MQKHVNIVDLVKSFPTNIFLQNLASIQQRTSLIKFDHLDVISEYDSISNLSTKLATTMTEGVSPNMRFPEFPRTSCWVSTASSSIDFPRIRFGRSASFGKPSPLRAADTIAAWVVYPGVFGAWVLGGDLGDLYAESRQTLQGSFSAVSKPNFASKYSLE